ncbi:ATP-binding protein [Halorarum salinum]|uniref:ATP-binding protein n=1 Tax=Halorarum salinum TaxID=2743089 RepID=A0A7D5LD87_9EURY|nr:DUF87 domain-containing protein [Halobaculum salinum]QLG63871.1 ATP-binding protein [Halobaculum salinum]
MSDIPDEIKISEDGTTVPVIELLTGRGFVTGKSGSGKSNTASVVAEELLELDLPMLIVDTDGEYYGLKERYELLHVGAGELCDVQVSPTHAQRIATLALEENVPVILDVSEYLDVDEARQLIHGVVKTLFVREKKAKKPFMLLVEECHEYLPESGGLDEVGEILLQVAKRGRKRGLGLCGMSQRPAAVDKDFITQCDWLVWHRLTWENDTKVVGRFLDNEYAEMVEELNDGEAIVVTDWDEQVSRVQFRRKKTFDAGATPGLEDVERPDFRSISVDLEEELENIDPSAGPGSHPADDVETIGDSAGGSGAGSTSGSGGLEAAASPTDPDDDGGSGDGADSTGTTADAGTSGTADVGDGSADVENRPADSGSGATPGDGTASGAMTMSDPLAAASGGGSTTEVVATDRRRASADDLPRKPPAPKRPEAPSRPDRRKRRRNRSDAEEDIVLEASHLVAYGVESAIWRFRRGVFRVRYALRRWRYRFRRRMRRAGRELDLDPRLLTALLFGVVGLVAAVLLFLVL